MGRREVSWKGRTESGERRQVFAELVGDRWRFYERGQRFDCWQAVPEPPLEDWLELLDGVKRRVARRLLRPEEEDRVRRAIGERFPEASF